MGPLQHVAEEAAQQTAALQACDVALAERRAELDAAAAALEARRAELEELSGAAPSHPCPSLVLQQMSVAFFGKFFCFSF